MFDPIEIKGKFQLIKGANQNHRMPSDLHTDSENALAKSTDCASLNSAAFRPDTTRRWQANTTFLQKHKLHPLNTHCNTLIPTAKGWLRTLQIGLLFSSMGWGISFYFTFATWDSASDQLYLMGAGTIEYNPLLDYWLRMASAAFGCIGIASIIACIRPVFFHGLILLLGPFHAFVGAVLAISASRNHLNTESHPTFVADITFCFLTSVLIMFPLAVAYRSRTKSAEDAT